MSCRFDLTSVPANFIIVEPGYLYHLSAEEIRFFQHELQFHQASLVYLDATHYISLEPIVHRNEYRGDQQLITYLETLFDLKKKVAVYYPEKATIQDVIDLQNILNCMFFYQGGDIKSLVYHPDGLTGFYLVTLATKDESMEIR